MEKLTLEERITEQLETMAFGSKQSNEYFLKHYNVTKKSALKHNIKTVNELIKKLK